MDNNITYQLKYFDNSILEDRGSYVSGMRLFFSLFGEIASMKKLDRIDVFKALHYIDLHLKEGLIHTFRKEDFRKPKEKTGIFNVIYLYNERIMIDIDYDGSINILYTPKEEQRAEYFTQHLFKFRERKKATHDIRLVIQEQGGLSTFKTKLNKPKLSIEKHYNDDLGPAHKLILNIIKKDRESGLILFHGTPGTGKSTYIRYLIHLQKKKVIFLPSGLARNLDMPALTAFLIVNQNSILVIEDAEELLASRDLHSNSGISMLLNITDGLLGESLGIQVICTFNTQVANIDKALLRKGRLKAMYEFKPLTPQKANQLIREIHPNRPNSNEPMTLADIFHINENEQQEVLIKRAKIGFAALSN